MRLYHPKTLQILASREDIPKRYSCSVWSEIFKWKASGKSHPKCFIDNDYYLGIYLKIVYIFAKKKGCNLDDSLIQKHFDNPSVGRYLVGNGFKNVTEISNRYFVENEFAKDWDKDYFNDNYLFSDACSLYFKGINIFPDIFGDEWRKMVPVESHKEIKRQVDKYLEVNK